MQGYDKRLTEARMKMRIKKKEGGAPSLFKAMLSSDGLFSAGIDAPLPFLVRYETKAHRNGRIDALHNGGIQMPHLFTEAALVQRADLLKQDNGVLGKSNLIGIDINMRR